MQASSIKGDYDVLELVSKNFNLIGINKATHKANAQDRLAKIIHFLGLNTDFFF